MVDCPNRGSVTAYSLPPRTTVTPFKPPLSVPLGIVSTNSGEFFRSVDFALDKYLINMERAVHQGSVSKSASSPDLGNSDVKFLELPGISRRCESPSLLAVADFSSSTRATGVVGSLGSNGGFFMESPLIFPSSMSGESPQLGSPASGISMSKNDFEIVSLIGYGHSGTVVQLVKQKESGEFFAMKTVDKWSLIERRNLGDVKAIDRASAERDLHVTLGKDEASCPYFVKLFYSFQSPRNLYFILEFCPCDVLEYINQYGPLSVEEAVLFVAELACAVDHLHRSGSIHRDIKTDNILVSRSGHVRLSDFGSSKRIETDQHRCDSVVGFSLSIMPPEFFSGLPSYGSAIDWFQVGICAFEVLTGKPPFDGRPLRTIDSPDYPPPWPEYISIPSPIKTLVEALLHPNETVRLSSFAAVRSAISEISTNTDWDSIIIGSTQTRGFPHVSHGLDQGLFFTPRMMSSVSSDDYDVLPLKSFSYIRP